ncbi:unnamed protein product [Arabidopsis halleri]
MAELELPSRLFVAEQSHQEQSRRFFQFLPKKSILLSHSHAYVTDCFFRYLLQTGAQK